LRIVSTILLSRKTRSAFTKVFGRWWHKALLLGYGSELILAPRSHFQGPRLWIVSSANTVISTATELTRVRKSKPRQSGLNRTQCDGALVLHCQELSIIEIEIRFIDDSRNRRSHETAGLIPVASSRLPHSHMPMCHPHNNTRKGVSRERSTRRGQLFATSGLFWHGPWQVKFIQSNNELKRYLQWKAAFKPIPSHLFCKKSCPLRWNCKTVANDLGFLLSLNISA
jgi:hypothetical protein